MTVRAKRDGDSGDTLFVMRDPERRYSLPQVVKLLASAEEMGFPLQEGTYLEQMTIGQLEALLNGKGDA